MEQDSNFIERGNAAEHLLQSPTFMSVANTLMDTYMQDILRSDPKDTQAREAGYAQARAVQDIVGILNQWLTVRDQIIANSQPYEEQDSI